MTISSSILAQYKAEVRDAERWLKEHRLICVQCNRALRGRDPQGNPCATGLRIRRYGEMNSEIVAKLAAVPGSDELQGVLF